MSDIRKPTWSLMITAALWTIWLGRNRKVFENIEILVTTVSGQCQSMVTLWSREARNEERSAILQWIDEIYIHL